MHGSRRVLSSESGASGEGSILKIIMGIDRITTDPFGQPVVRLCPSSFWMSIGIWPFSASVMTRFGGSTPAFNGNLQSEASGFPATRLGGKWGIGSSIHL
jgi:hypothetical protein